MKPDTLLPLLLIAQGVIGAIDTLVNHELIVRLPHRAQARTEVGIHVLREAAYGLMFGLLAWLAWHGIWAALIGALLMAVIVIDAWDEFVENRTRVLPQNERLLHFLLILNLGFIAIGLAPTLLGWSANRTGVTRADHGMLSWILSVLALGAIGWSIRDFFSWRALCRKGERR